MRSALSLRRLESTPRPRKQSRQPTVSQSLTEAEHKQQRMLRQILRALAQQGTYIYLAQPSRDNVIFHSHSLAGGSDDEPFILTSQDLAKPQAGLTKLAKHLLDSQLGIAWELSPTSSTERDRSGRITLPYQEHSGAQPDAEMIDQVRCAALALLAQTADSDAPIEIQGGSRAQRAIAYQVLKAVDSRLVLKIDESAKQLAEQWQATNFLRTSSPSADRAARMDRAEPVPPPPLPSMEREHVSRRRQQASGSSAESPPLAVATVSPQRLDSSDFDEPTEEQSLLEGFQVPDSPWLAVAYRQQLQDGRSTPLPTPHQPWLTDLDSPAWRELAHDLWVLEVEKYPGHMASLTLSTARPYQLTLPDEHASPSMIHLADMRATRYAIATLTVVQALSDPAVRASYGCDSTRLPSERQVLALLADFRAPLHGDEPRSSKSRLEVFKGQLVNLLPMARAEKVLTQADAAIRPFRRPVTVQTTPLADGHVVRQTVTPMTHITDAQKGDIRRITEDDQPVWFKELDPSVQWMLRRQVIRIRSIEDGDTPEQAHALWEDLAAHVSSSFRGMPLLSNWVQVKTEHLDAQGRVLSCSSSTTHSVSTPIDLKAFRRRSPISRSDDEVARLTSMMLRQSMEAQGMVFGDLQGEPSKAQQAFAVRWGIEDASAVTVSYTSVSLLSPLPIEGLTGRLGLIASDNNRRMLLYKERALDAFRDPHGTSRLAENHTLYRFNFATNLLRSYVFRDAHTSNQREAWRMFKDLTANMQLALPDDTPASEHLAEIRRLLDQDTHTSLSDVDHQALISQIDALGAALDAGPSGCPPDRVADMKRLFSAMKGYVDLSARAEGYPPVEHHSQLMMCSYVETMLDACYGEHAALDKHCKSGKDRTYTQHIHTQAMRLYADQHEGRLPSVDDPADSQERQAFVRLYAQLYLSGIAREVASGNAHGAYGIKLLGAKITWPKSLLFGSWRTVTMLPSDIQKAIQHELKNNDAFASLNKLSGRQKPSRRRQVVKTITSGLVGLLSINIVFGVTALLVLNVNVALMVGVAMLGVVGVASTAGMITQLTRLAVPQGLPTRDWHQQHPIRSAIAKHPLRVALLAVALVAVPSAAMVFTLGPISLVALAGMLTLSLGAMLITRTLQKGHVSERAVTASTSKDTPQETKRLISSSRDTPVEALMLEDEPPPPLASPPEPPVDAHEETFSGDEDCASTDLPPPPSRPPPAEPPVRADTPPTVLESTSPTLAVGRHASFDQAGTTARRRRRDRSRMRGSPSGGREDGELERHESGRRERPAATSRRASAWPPREALEGMSGDAGGERSASRLSQSSDDG